MSMLAVSSVGAERCCQFHTKMIKIKWSKLRYIKRLLNIVVMKLDSPMSSFMKNIHLVQDSKDRFVSDC